ncbi:MAG: hypothetical protein LBV41_09175 [Cytophagaceae bacterium]|jgi:predicted thioesterase|nr:hypothetical protein [Cytophagaceae bacterium]
MKIIQIEEGIRLTLEKRVEEKELAADMETSDVPVLSTSALISFLEKAVTKLIDPYLPECSVAVSIEINMRHLKPVGLKELIRCTVHLKYVEKNRLFFDVVILNECHEQVAMGAHCRQIVNKDDFVNSVKKH